MSINPNFSATPITYAATCGLANATRDGGYTTVVSGGNSVKTNMALLRRSSGTLYPTGGINGTRIDRIVANAAATSSAGGLNLFIERGYPLIPISSVTILNPGTLTYGQLPENSVGASGAIGAFFANNTPIAFWGTDCLNLGLRAGNCYYVVNATASNFQISLTSGGVAISFVGCSFVGNLYAQCLGIPVVAASIATPSAFTLIDTLDFSLGEGYVLSNPGTLTTIVAGTVYYMISSALVLGSAQFSSTLAGTGVGCGGVYTAGPYWSTAPKLLSSLAVTAVTASTTVPPWSGTFALPDPLEIPSGWNLYVTTEIASATTADIFHIVATGGDF